MKPLREYRGSPDPSESQTAQLLSEVGPLARSSVSEQRVWRRLQRQQAAPALRRAQSVWAVGIVLGLAATAAAFVGGMSLFRPTMSSDRVSTESGGGSTVGASSVRRNGSSNTAADPERTTQARVPGAGATSSSTNAQPRSAGVVGPSAPTTAGGKTEPRALASKHSPASSPTTSLPALGASSDARLVQEAVTALRSEKDPARAEALLQQYRRQSTSGVLAEEALALSIEVALAKKDPRAAELGRQYLGAYPKGRFQAVARRAVERAMP